MDGADVKESVESYWDEESRDYNESRNRIFEKVDYGPKVPGEKDLGLLEDIVGKKVLELGCGAGEVSIALSKIGAECTGIDISKEQVEEARRNAEEEEVEVDFFKGDMEDLDFEDRAFDRVVSVFAVQWAPETGKVFREAFRVLKSGGLFVFSLEHPFYTCFSKRDDELVVKNSYFQEEKQSGTFTDGLVVQTPTVSQLVNKAVKTGFSVEKIVEPEPTGESQFKSELGGVELFPEEKLEKVPGTLILRCRKP